jgi:hypothetical protein
LRFVYITHDLPFALSRRGASHVILKTNSRPEIVKIAEGLPLDLAESLLSAASFSIHAKRIIFCEGEEGKSMDYKLYSAWFLDSETTVMPVGGCREVHESVSNFADSKFISGLSALGIVDLDYWPSAYIECLPKQVVALRVHEVENLFCIEEVFVAVAEHLGKSGDCYAPFIVKAKSKFDSQLFAYQVSERFKRRIDNEFFTARNRLKPPVNMEELSESYEKGLDAKSWQTPVRTILAEEQTRLQAGLTGTALEFLALYPAKVFLNEVKNYIGLEMNSYIDLICEALSSTPNLEHKLNKLGLRIEAALMSFLPPRK